MRRDWNENYTTSEKISLLSTFLGYVDVANMKIITK